MFFERRAHTDKGCFSSKVLYVGGFIWTRQVKSGRKRGDFDIETMAVRIQSLSEEALTIREMTNVDALRPRVRCRSSATGDH